MRLKNLIFILCIFATCSSLEESMEYKAEPVMVSINTETNIVNEISSVEIDIKEEETKEADEEDVELLSRLLMGECGSDWCSDTMIYYTASVVLNRMEDENYPNTLEGVIYQKGQYACTWDGGISKEPTDRCYKIAKEVLENGSVLPKNVLYQAEFSQGSGLYEQVQNMKFCYR